MSSAGAIPGIPSSKRVGHILRRMPTESFRLTPPEIYNRHLIPSDSLAAMERTWSQENFKDREIVFSSIEAATIAGEGLVFTDTLIFCSESFTFHSFEEVEKARQDTLEKRKSGNITKYNGNYVLCKKNGSSNYGHWLMEMFPKASVFVDEFPERNWKFIVPSTDPVLQKVILECMHRIGIPAENLLPLNDSPVWIEHLVVVEGLTAHGTYMSPHVITAVRKIAQNVEGGPYPKLYVPRSSQYGRNFINANAVSRYAINHGFVPFDTEDTNFETQIQFFAGATHLVGIMGASMTNIVFSPPNAEVTILAPAGMADTFFWFIASLCKLQYVEVRCEVEGGVEERTGWRRPMVFPVNNVQTIFPPVPWIKSVSADQMLSRLSQKLDADPGTRTEVAADILSDPVAKFITSPESVVNDGELENNILNFLKEKSTSQIDDFMIVDAATYTNLLPTLHPVFRQESPYAYPDYVLKAAARRKILEDLVELAKNLLYKAVKSEHSAKALHEHFVCDDLGHQWTEWKDLPPPVSIQGKRRYVCLQCRDEIDEPRAQEI